MIQQLSGHHRERTSSNYTDGSYTDSSTVYYNHPASFNLAHKAKTAPQAPTEGMYYNDNYYPTYQDGQHMLLTHAYDVTFYPPAEHVASPISYEPMFKEDMNQWKTSTGIRKRPESLKIETRIHQRMEKPFEPTSNSTTSLVRKVSKEEVVDVKQSVLLQKLNATAQQQIQDESNTLQRAPKKSSSIPTLSPTQEEFSFAASENYFQTVDSPSSSGIPSPWGTTRSKRSSYRESTSTEVVPRLTVPDEATGVTATQPDAPTETEPACSDIIFKAASLSIASCSLINVKSNIKLYRRMAIKTRNQDTQITYAKYLLQIAKLYQKKTIPTTATVKSSSNKKQNKPETPSETRHRLLVEAGYWIERLARMGNPEALYLKGKWYLLGPNADDCVLQGYEKVQESKALKCFKVASFKGWVDAHYELANIFKRKGHYKKAITLYKKGAEENHTLSVYKLSKIYLRGQLKQKKDIELGMSYLQKAADTNDNLCGEPAFVLGCIYANQLKRIGLISHIGKANHGLALHYLKKSAHYGYPDALYFMGQVHEVGLLGQLQDSWQAYQYYVRASEVNHAGAMLDLAIIYTRGIPGFLSAQNDIAFKWCKKSADLGFDQAEYTLGKYYEEGVGVTPDINLAYEYYGKAASKDYPLAQEKLNRHLADYKRNPVANAVRLDEDDESLILESRNGCYIQ
ncbi:HCP-like protein [Backusella circina FSU 941]|nr:HCP-like protein [Backusella circina FSU 941]